MEFFADGSGIMVSHGEPEHFTWSTISAMLTIFYEEWEWIARYSISDSILTITFEEDSGWNGIVTSIITLRRAR